MIIVVIFITTSNKKYYASVIIIASFTAHWVLTKLFIDPNDTIINKKITLHGDETPQ